jgi:uncharacterized protein YndB with AHSA1/START domain
MEPLTFEQWLKQEGYYSYKEIKERVFVEGGSESDVDAEMSPIHHAYDEYLEELKEDDS